MKKVLASIILIWAGTSFAQDNYAQWSNYKDITLNTTSAGANVANSVTNFPVLVRLTSVNSDIFTQAATGGADIRFAKSNGVHLPYQIERWDAVNQAAEIWVLVDTVLGNSSSQSIRMFWSKAGAVDSSSGNSVFSPSNGYVSVWHLGDAAGTSPRPNALTGGFSATPVNFPNNYSTPQGVIGMADSLVGGPGRTSGLPVPYLQVDSGTATTLYNFPNGTMTYSVWIYPIRATANARMLEMAGVLATGNDRIWMGWNGTAATPSWRYNVGTAGSQQNSPSNTVSLNQWHQFTGIIGRNGSSDTTRFYLDGVAIGSVLSTTTQLPNTSRTFVFLGRDFEADGDSALAGKLDEAQISNVTRSPNWIKLSYQNQQATQSLVALGSSQIQAVAPGAPTGVSATAGNAQATVSWTAPASNGGATITVYTTTAVQDTTKHCTAASLNCTVTGLTNGTSYTFTVTATNSAGTGTASSPSVAVVPVTVPGTPTAVTDTAFNAQVKVVWVAPSTDGGSAITGYTVTSVQDTTKHCTTTGSLTCTVSGLTNNTAYSFIVTATNAVGTGAASTASALVTPTAPVGAPDAPVIGTVTAGNAQVTVNWTAAGTGFAATGFTATSSPDGKSCSTTGALTCVVTGLNNGTLYTFKVVATNASGPSGPSAASASATPVGAPDAPTGVTGAAGNAQVIVSWTAGETGGSAITGFKAMAVADTTKSCTTTGALTCTVTGLTNGTSYTFVVKATNAIGTSIASAASIAVTPATVPGAPSITTVAGASGQVTVTWTAASTGGSVITGYKAMAVADTTKSCTTTGALSCAVTGLTNTTAYTFVVKATNALGTGVVSAPSASVTGVYSQHKGMNMHLVGNSTMLQLPAFTGTAQISMMDIWGRTVWNKTVNSGTRNVSWSLSNGRSMKAGVYIVRLSIGEADSKFKSVYESKIMITP